jgi:hypothetical protein
MAARFMGITLLALAAFGFASAAEARTTLRCPDGLIRNDDPRILVLKRCGDPIDVQQTSIFHRAIVHPGAFDARAGERRAGSRILLGDAWIHGQEEVWTYNFGPNQFMRQIRFVNGRVRGIEALRHYGFRVD